MARLYTYDCVGEIMRDLVVDESLYFSYEDFLRVELGVPYESKGVDPDSPEVQDAFLVTAFQDWGNT